MTSRRGLIAAVLLLVGHAASDAQTPAHDIVVRVRCGSSHAGGIVSRSAQGMLEIVTAKHVVDSCSDRPAQVELRSTQGQPFSAEVVHRSRRLDVALLRVTDRRVPRFTAEQLHVAGESLLVQRGHLVKPVVHTFERAWFTPQRADIVSDADGDVIVFESSAIDVGASGGALLNAEGLIIGMIATTTRTTAQALPLHRIKASLLADQFEVQWDLPGEPSSPTRGPIWPREPEPAVVEETVGNIIYRMPPGWKRREGKNEHLLYYEYEPPFGPHIILRSGARLNGEFLGNVKASLAEGNNIKTYRELRYSSMRGMRMYQMDDAEMIADNGNVVHLFYVALNAEDRFDELALFMPNLYGMHAQEAIKVFERLVNTVDLVDARRRRQAQ